MAWSSPHAAGLQENSNPHLRALAGVNVFIWIDHLGVLFLAVDVAGERRDDLAERACDILEKQRGFSSGWTVYVVDQPPETGNDKYRERGRAYCFVGKPVRTYPGEAGARYRAVMEVADAFPTYRELGWRGGNRFYMGADKPLPDAGKLRGRVCAILAKHSVAKRVTFKLIDTKNVKVIDERPCDTAE